MEWLWNKIVAFYNFCGKYDKWSHRIGGGIFALIQLIHTSTIWISYLISFLTASSLFFLKEYIDCHRKNPTGFSWRDIRNGYIGWAMSTTIITILKLI